MLCRGKTPGQDGLAALLLLVHLESLGATMGASGSVAMRWRCAATMGGSQSALRRTKA